jgi:hypothetical protein
VSTPDYEFTPEDATKVEWEKHTYRAVVSRGPEKWVVEVPELGVSTMARSISRVAQEAATAIMLGPVEPEWGFTVETVMANPYAPDKTLPMVVLCDIDGTLAERGDRGPYEFDRVGEDLVKEPTRMVIDCLVLAGHEVILLSGRSEEYREQTERWLHDNTISYSDMYMRPAGDRRSDDLVKMELFDNHIREKYYAWLMLDDRDRCVELWRKIDLTCWQVAPGDF